MVIRLSMGGEGGGNGSFFPLIFLFMLWHKYVASHVTIGQPNLSLIIFCHSRLFFFSPFAGNVVSFNVTEVY